MTPIQSNGNIPTINKQIVSDNNIASKNITISNIDFNDENNNPNSLSNVPISKIQNDNLNIGVGSVFSTYNFNDGKFGINNIDLNKYPNILLRDFPIYNLGEAQDINAERQGLEMLPKAIGQTITTIVGDIISGVGSVGGLIKDNPIANLGTIVSDWGREVMPIYLTREDEKGLLNSFSWRNLASGAPSIGSAVSSFAPMIGGVRLISLLGKSLTKIKSFGRINKATSLIDDANLVKEAARAGEFLNNLQKISKADRFANWIGRTSNIIGRGLSTKTAETITGGIIGAHFDTAIEIVHSYKSWKDYAKNTLGMTEEDATAYADTTASESYWRGWAYGFMFNSISTFKILKSSKTALSSMPTLNSQLRKDMLALVKDANYTGATQDILSKSIKGAWKRNLKDAALIAISEGFEEMRVDLALSLGEAQAQEHFGLYNAKANRSFAENMWSHLGEGKNWDSFIYGALGGLTMMGLRGRVSAIAHPKKYREDSYKMYQQYFTGLQNTANILANFNGNLEPDIQTRTNENGKIVFDGYRSVADELLVPFFENVISNNATRQGKQFLETIVRMSQDELAVNGYGENALQVANKLLSEFNRADNLYMNATEKLFGTKYDDIFQKQYANLLYRQEIYKEEIDAIQEKIAEKQNYNKSLIPQNIEFNDVTKSLFEYINVEQQITKLTDGYHAVNENLDYLQERQKSDVNKRLYNKNVENLDFYNSYVAEREKDLDKLRNGLNSVDIGYDAVINSNKIYQKELIKDGNFEEATKVARRIAYFDRKRIQDLKKEKEILDDIKQAKIKASQFQTIKDTNDLVLKDIQTRIDEFTSDKINLEERLRKLNQSITDIETKLNDSDNTISKLNLELYKSLSKEQRRIINDNEVQVMLDAKKYLLSKLLQNEMELRNFSNTAKESSKLFDNAIAKVKENDIEEEDENKLKPVIPTIPVINELPKPVIDTSNISNTNNTNLEEEENGTVPTVQPQVLSANQKYNLTVGKYTATVETDENSNVSSININNRLYISGDTLNFNKRVVEIGNIEVINREVYILDKNTNLRIPLEELLYSEQNIKLELQKVFSFLNKGYTVEEVKNDKQKQRQLLIALNSIVGYYTSETNESNLITIKTFLNSLNEYKGIFDEFNEKLEKINNDVSNKIQISRIYNYLQTKINRSSNVVLSAKLQNLLLNIAKELIKSTKLYNELILFSDIDLFQKNIPILTQLVNELLIAAKTEFNDAGLNGDFIQQNISAIVRDYITKAYSTIEKQNITSIENEIDKLIDFLNNSKIEEIIKSRLLNYLNAVKSAYNEYKEIGEISTETISNLEEQKIDNIDITTIGSLDDVYFIQPILNTIQQLENKLAPKIEEQVAEESSETDILDAVFALTTSFSRNPKGIDTSNQNENTEIPVEDDLNVMLTERASKDIDRKNKIVDVKYFISTADYDLLFNLINTLNTLKLGSNIKLSKILSSIYQMQNGEKLIDELTLQLYNLLNHITNYSFIKGLEQSINRAKEQGYTIKNEATFSTMIATITNAFGISQDGKNSAFKQELRNYVDIYGLLDVKRYLRRFYDTHKRGDENFQLKKGLNIGNTIFENLRKKIDTALQELSDFVTINNTKYSVKDLIDTFNSLEVGNEVQFVELDNDSLDIYITTLAGKKLYLGNIDVFTDNNIRGNKTIIIDKKTNKATYNSFLGTIHQRNPNMITFVDLLVRDSIKKGSSKGFKNAITTFYVEYNKKKNTEEEIKILVDKLLKEIQTLDNANENKYSNILDELLYINENENIVLSEIEYAEKLSGLLDVVYYRTALEDVPTQYININVVNGRVDKYNKILINNFLQKYYAYRDVVEHNQKLIISDISKAGYNFNENSRVQNNVKENIPVSPKSGKIEIISKLSYTEGFEANSVIKDRITNITTNEIDTITDIKFKENNTIFYTPIYNDNGKYLSAIPLRQGKINQFNDYNKAAQWFIEQSIVKIINDRFLTYNSETTNQNEKNIEFTKLLRKMGEVMSTAEYLDGFKDFNVSMVYINSNSKTIKINSLNEEGKAVTFKINVFYDVNGNPQEITIAQALNHGRQVGTYYAAFKEMYANTKNYTATDKYLKVNLVTKKHFDNFQTDILSKIVSGITRNISLKVIDNKSQFSTTIDGQNEGDLLGFGIQENGNFKSYVISEYNKAIKEKKISGQLLQEEYDSIQDFYLDTNALTVGITAIKNKNGEIITPFNLNSTPNIYIGVKDNNPTDSPSENTITKQNETNEITPLDSETKVITVNPIIEVDRNKEAIDLLSLIANNTKATNTNFIEQLDKLGMLTKEVFYTLGIVNQDIRDVDFNLIKNLFKETFKNSKYRLILANTIQDYSNNKLNFDELHKEIKKLLSSITNEENIDEKIFEGVRGMNIPSKQLIIINNNNSHKKDVLIGKTLLHEVIHSSFKNKLQNGNISSEHISKLKIHITLLNKLAQSNTKYLFLYEEIDKEMLQAYARLDKSSLNKNQLKTLNYYFGENGIINTNNYEDLVAYLFNDNNFVDLLNNIKYIDFNNINNEESFWHKIVRILLDALNINKDSSLNRILNILDDNTSPIFFPLSGIEIKTKNEDVSSNELIKQNKNKSKKDSKVVEIQETQETISNNEDIFDENNSDFSLNMEYIQSPNRGEKIYENNSYLEIFKNNYIDESGLKPC